MHFLPDQYRTRKSDLQINLDSSIVRMLHYCAGMAALLGDAVVLPHATDPQALELQNSQSELRRRGVNYVHSQVDCGTAPQNDDWDEQSLTLVNSHPVVGVPIEVETIEYDLGQDPEVVGVTVLSNLGGRQVKARPSTSSMHCVSFHDLTYQVTQRKCCRRLPDKTILNSVR